MRLLLLPAALLTLAAALLPLGAPPTYACSCALQTPRQYVGLADIVATGKVIRLYDTREPRSGAEDRDAVFLVQRYLKGAGPRQINVDDPVGDGDCGFIDVESLGQPYVLFLSGSESPFQTSICSGSTHLAGAQQDQLFLADVVAITGQGSLPAPSGGGDLPWPQIVLASALGGLALVAATAYLLRRRIIGRG